MHWWAFFKKEQRRYTMKKSPYETIRGTQAPSKGILPQKRNAHSFSKENQPAIKTKKRAIAYGSTRKTQAQQAMSAAGYNPMERMILLATKYEDMISTNTNWRGGEASSKEFDYYIKEYSKLNETLARYFSSTAPIETSMEPSTEEPVKPGAPVEYGKDEPLTQKELMTARRTMIGRLEDKL